MRVALSVVKSKCAAIHYETQIAAHIATGSDMGDMGHSYKQFNEILKAAYPNLTKILCTSWQGNVLDGQYQAKGEFIVFKQYFCLGCNSCTIP